MSDQLRPLVAGRMVVLATADPPGPALRHLRELDAGQMLVLGPATCRPLTSAVNAELVRDDRTDWLPGFRRAPPRLDQLRAQAAG